MKTIREVIHEWTALGDIDLNAPATIRALTRDAEHCVIGVKEVQIESVKPTSGQLVVPAEQVEDGSMREQRDELLSACKMLIQAPANDLGSDQTARAYIRIRELVRLYGEVR